MNKPKNLKEFTAMIKLRTDTRFHIAELKREYHVVQQRKRQSDYQSWEEDRFVSIPDEIVVQQGILREIDEMFPITGKFVGRLIDDFDVAHYTEIYDTLETAVRMRMRLQSHLTREKKMTWDSWNHSADRYSTTWLYHKGHYRFY